FDYPACLPGALFVAVGIVAAYLDQDGSTLRQLVANELRGHLTSSAMQMVRRRDAPARIIIPRFGQDVQRRAQVVVGLKARGECHILVDPRQPRRQATRGVAYGTMTGSPAGRNPGLCRPA